MRARAGRAGGGGRRVVARSAAVTPPPRTEIVLSPWGGGRGGDFYSGKGWELLREVGLWRSLWKPPQPRILAETVALPGKPLASLAPPSPCHLLFQGSSAEDRPLAGWLAGWLSVGALFMCVYLGPAVFSAQQVTLARGLLSLPRQSLLTYPWASGLVFIT